MFLLMYIHTTYVNQWELKTHGINQVHDNVESNVGNQNEVHPLRKFGFSKLDGEEYCDNRQNVRCISSANMKYDGNLLILLNLPENSRELTRANAASWTMVDFCFRDVVFKNWKRFRMPGLLEFCLSLPEKGTDRLEEAKSCGNCSQDRVWTVNLGQ